MLVQLSGIGVDGHSPSRYISARARGEAAVRDELATAILLRPAVMFGPDDTFLHGIEQATRLPVIPLFGRGDTRLQPAYVHDVAMAIVRIAQRQYHGEVFELGGAETLTYRQLVEAVCEQAGRRRWLLPFPFALWKPLVHIMSLLPDPPMTIDQLYLLSTDNVATGNVKTFQDLSLQPGAVTDLIGDCLGL